MFQEKLDAGLILVSLLLDVLQVLTYGAERQVILKASDADGSCVLACALAASYLLTQNDSEQPSPDVYLNAAKSNLVLSLILCFM